jgi:hypothetical protein
MSNHANVLKAIERFESWATPWQFITDVYLLSLLTLEMANSLSRSGSLPVIARSGFPLILSHPVLLPLRPFFWSASHGYRR